jgi:hypothetical protein
MHWAIVVLAIGRAIVVSSDGATQAAEKARDYLSRTAP